MLQHPDSSDFKHAVHISDIRLFNSCRLKWSWAGQYTRNLRPRVPEPALWLGTGIHQAVERFHRGGRQQSVRYLFTQWLNSEAQRFRGDGLAPETRKLVAESASLGLSISDAYEAWFEQQIGDQMEFLKVEETFHVPIISSAGATLWDVALTGRIDGIVRYQGKLWVYELKTSANLDAFQSGLDIDPQCSAYQYAMDTLGTPVAGTIYVLIRKKDPDLSRLNWEYVRMLQVTRDSTELSVFADDLFMQASEMTNPYVQIWPNPGPFTCGSCNFKMPCRSRHMRLDPEPFIGIDFRGADEIDTDRNVEA